MSSALQQLLDRARGPAGPRVDLRFERPERAYRELEQLLAATNGCWFFNAGVQVFHAGDIGLGPDLASWNAAETWKDTYGDLAADLFCFAQDVLGTQFAIDQQARVITLDPETGDREVLGPSLEDWASWLLEDAAVRGCGGIATAWQDAKGALAPDERLVPRQFFVFGGSYELDNLLVVDAVRAMRIRGPIAQQVHALPDGARLRFELG